MMGYHRSRNKVISAENPKLSKVSFCKFGVGQNVALHVLPTARNYIFLILPFLCNKVFFSSLFLFKHKTAHIMKEETDFTSKLTHFAPF